MASSPLKATWQKIHLEGIPSNLAARSSHNLSLLDGCAYIFGGELSPRTPIGDEILVIDLKKSSKSNSSSTINAKCNVIRKPFSESNNQQTWPNARIGAAMTAHPASKSLLLWGGRGGKEMKAIDVRTENDQSSTSIEDVWKFDIGSNKWSQFQTRANESSDFPVARSFHTMTSLINGSDNVYVHAGCPAQGRLSSLNALDLKTLTWNALPTGPDPGRGGTVIIPIRSTKQNQPDLLARWGGFCGYELGGPLEIFDTVSKKWTSHVTFVEGKSGQEPAKRSVHGFMPYNSASDKDTTITFDSKQKQILAIMFMGEGEGAPKELGHDGAGKFLNDVYALLRSDDGSYSWLSLITQSDNTNPPPEPRGWFAFDAQPAEDGSGTEIVIHGGLNESNTRLSDAWVLRVSLVK